MTATVSGQMKFHVVCTMYPDMPADEFKGFKESIRKRGQKNPCLMFGDEMIDGKNRWRACQELGIPVRVEQWEGKEEDLIDFVADLNEERRHLTASQRGAVAATRKRLIEQQITKGRPKNEDNSVKNDKLVGDPRNARKEAAEKHSVSEGYVHAAEKIQEMSPETFEEVKQGKVTIPQAKKKLGIGKPKKPKKPTGQVGETVAGGYGRIVSEETINEDAQTPEEAAECAAEASEERAAIQADQSDDDWVKSLPLYSKLSGVQQKTFVDDALRYRFLERTIAAARKKSSESMNKYRRLGPFGNRVRRFFCIDPPEKWILCTTTENGGCGGTGSMIGLGLSCPKCKSYGFWING